MELHLCLDRRSLRLGAAVVPPSRRASTSSAAAALLAAALGDGTNARAAARKLVAHLVELRA